MKVRVLQVTVRRDAHTITPTTASEHEIAILQTVFGEEHVLVGDAVGQIEVGDGEFDRLAAKYGGNEEGLLVEQVFGKRASRGLENAIKAVAVSNAAVSKKKGRAPAGNPSGDDGSDSSNGDSDATPPQE